MRLSRNPIVTQDLERIAELHFLADYFYGKTVLISGASGFLPTYLVETLLYLNDNCSAHIKVLGLVRNLERAHKRFAAYQGRPDLHLFYADITQHLKIDGPVDVIVHAASQASPLYYKSDPLGTIGPNVFGTNRLLELAAEKRTGAFLFFSSGEVYGVLSEESVPTAETIFGRVDPMNLRSCYAESKRMGESLCASWFGEHHIPTKVVRLFHTYGPGLKANDGRVFADFVTSLVKNQDLVLTSDGSATRAYCYVSDAIRGILYALCLGKSGEAYNIGNDKEQISVLSLAETLVNLFPEKHLKVLFKKPELDSAYLASPVPRSCPDIEKVRALGWEPTISIREGFKRTVESFHEFN